MKMKEHKGLGRAKSRKPQEVEKPEVEEPRNKEFFYNEQLSLVQGRGRPAEETLG